MMRKVHCKFLNREAEALQKMPYPGVIGEKIYKSIFREAWQRRLERSVMINNEYQFNSAGPENQDLIEKHMLGFLLNEGEYRQAPGGYNPEESN